MTTANRKTKTTPLSYKTVAQSIRLHIWLLSTNTPVIIRHTMPSTKVYCTRKIFSYVACSLRFEFQSHTTHYASQSWHTLQVFWDKVMTANHTGNLWYFSSKFLHQFLFVFYEANLSSVCIPVLFNVPCTVSALVLTITTFVWQYSKYNILHSNDCTVRAP